MVPSDDEKPKDRAIGRQRIRLVDKMDAMFFSRSLRVALFARLLKSKLGESLTHEKLAKLES